MTNLQRRNLQLYLRYRGRRMTIAGLFWANRRTYLLMCVLLGAIAAFVSTLAGHIGAAFVGVAGAVVILRDIGYFRRSAAIWPLLEQIIDWDRVEQLAGTDTRPS